MYIHAPAQTAITQVAMSAPRLTHCFAVSDGFLTPVASMIAWVLTLVVLVLPQAPSGAAGSSRRMPAAGPRADTLRQSSGSVLAGNGTLTILRHSGHGVCIPAR